MTTHCGVCGEVCCVAVASCGYCGVRVLAREYVMWLWWDMAVQYGGDGVW